jgi:hypothetical protein
MNANFWDIGEPIGKAAYAWCSRKSLVYLVQRLQMMISLM